MNDLNTLYASLLAQAGVAFVQNRLADYNVMFDAAVALKPLADKQPPRNEAEVPPAPTFHPPRPDSPPAPSLPAPNASDEALI